jgi:hypothetical protein
MRPIIINSSKRAALTASGDIDANRFYQIADRKKLVANGIGRS